MAGNFFHKIEDTVTGHKHSDTKAAANSDANTPTKDGFVPASGGFYNPGPGAGGKADSAAVTSASTAGTDTYDEPDRTAISQSTDASTGDSAHDTGSLGSSTQATQDGQRGITHTSAEGTSVSAGSDSAFSNDPTSANQSSGEYTQSSIESQPATSSADYTQTSSTGLSRDDETSGRAFAQSAEAQALEGEDGNLHGDGALNTGNTLRGRLHGQHTTASEEYGV